MTVIAGARTRCANCGDDLTGPFCAQCGQSARDLQRPFRTLLAEAFGEVFNLDARLLRTVRPLLVTPGRVAQEYLAGRRVAYVPPLRLYLIAALVFFGLFTVFPTTSPPISLSVAVAGSAEPGQARPTSGAGIPITIDLPQHVWFVDDGHLQDVITRARANPAAFALAGYRNIPRAFFVFLPILALLLKLFYRRRYYIDHLVFALYYQAFTFLVFTLWFLVGRLGWLPDVVVWALRGALALWTIAYLLMAVRRVYGDSWTRTAFKAVALVPLYVIGFLEFGFLFITVLAILTF